jgi:hypothetical protein
MYKKNTSFFMSLMQSHWDSCHDYLLWVFVSGLDSYSYRRSQNLIAKATGKEEILQHFK